MYLSLLQSSPASSSLPSLSSSLSSSSSSVLSSYRHRHYHYLRHCHHNRCYHSCYCHGNNYHSHFFFFISFFPLLLFEIPTVPLLLSLLLLDSLLDQLHKWTVISVHDRFHLSFSRDAMILCHSKHLNYHFYYRKRKLLPA
jgi:hypothetical protein